MRASQGVGPNSIPLLDTFSTCLGIATAGSCLYCFFPHTIKVYEDLCEGEMPELSEELIISQGRIVSFAVNDDNIVILFEDQKLEIRDREYWQKVQYSTSISHLKLQVTSLQLTSTTLILSCLDSQHTPTLLYLSLDLLPDQKQTSLQRCTAGASYRQILRLKELGNIKNFYLGLAHNEIRFGTYYRPDAASSSLCQFEFGKVKEENQSNHVHCFALVNWNRREQASQKDKTFIYLVKLVGIMGDSMEVKLSVKYRKFYEDQSRNPDTQIQEEEEVNEDNQEKREEAYKKMINTLFQINNLTENSTGAKEKKSDSLNQSSESRSLSSIKIEVSLQKGEKFVKLIQNKETLYFATNKRVFKFIINSQGNGQLVEILQLQNAQFVQAFQNKLYIALPSLYALNETGDFLSKNTKPVFTKKLNASVSTQTQALSDVLLDQIQEKNLSQMIDDLLLKKNIVEAQSQTDPIPPPIPQQPMPSLKPSTQKSIGDNLPLCPSSHERSLQRIEAILRSHQELNRKSMKTINDMLRAEQEKAKVQVLRKVEALVGSLLSNTVVPLVEDYVRHTFQAKLQQVNVYMYSLSMQNLLLLKQEIEKDQAKENMIRDQLIKRQFHEVAQSKKAVAEMVEICKKRELQKIVFFDEVKKRFLEMEKKVIQLEDKVKGIIQGEEVNEAKLLDEVEAIKSMLTHQKGRKKSVILEEREKDRKEEKKVKDDNQDNVEDEINEEEEEEEEEPGESEEEESSLDEEESEEETSSVSGSEAVKHNPMIGREMYSMPPPYNYYQTMASKLPPPPPHYFPQYPNYPPPQYPYPPAPAGNPYMGYPLSQPMFAPIFGYSGGVDPYMPSSAPSVKLPQSRVHLERKGSKQKMSEARPKKRKKVMEK